MQLQQAHLIAEHLVADFAPFCERIEIAGSVRRGKADVDDIEICAAPKMITQRDLFGAEAAVQSQLETPLSQLMTQAAYVKNGPRYKQIRLPEGINLDLFIVLPPAQWGVIVAIRTGPAEFSKWCVTPRMHGGAMPMGWRCDEGQITNGIEVLPMPEETDFLKFLGLGAVEPSQRAARWWLYGKSDGSAVSQLSPGGCS
jgi:DNA polymerase/3'-5' exonuclease PolX